MKYEEEQLRPEHSPEHVVPRFLSTVVCRCN